MKHLSENDQIEIKEALSYMHVDELKKQLKSLGLSSTAFNKNELIERLMHYIVTGKELAPLEIPIVSRALRGKTNFLDPQARMLYGSYKNDLATVISSKNLLENIFISQLRVSIGCANNG